MSPLRVLIVADDPGEAHELAEILSGCQVETASYADAPRKSPYDLVVLARPGDVRRLLEAARRQQASAIAFDGIQVDFTRGEVVKNGRKVKLTCKEFDLLRCLYEHRPKALSRDELLELVWESGGSFDPDGGRAHLGAAAETGGPPAAFEISPQPARSRIPLRRINRARGRRVAGLHNYRPPRTRSGGRSLPAMAAAAARSGKRSSFMRIGAASLPSSDEIPRSGVSRAQGLTNLMIEGVRQAYERYRTI